MDKQLTIRPGALASAVDFAAKRLDGRPNNPIGSCLHLSASDGRLTVSGYGENATARAIAEYDGDASGEVVVSGRLLGALVKSLPEGLATFEENGPHLAIAAGRGQWTLPTMPAEDYPSLPHPATIAGTVQGEAFADAIRRVAVAAGDNPARITLMAVQLGFGGESIQLAATDAIRAVRMSVPWEAETIPELAPLVMASVLRDAADAFDTDEPVTLGVNADGSGFSMTSATRALMSTTIRGDHPNGSADRLFAPKHSASFLLDARELAAPLKRAALMLTKEDTQRIKLRMAPGLLVLTAGSGSAGDEEVDIDYDGPPAVMHINVAYLADVLQTAPGGTVQMAFTPNSERPAPVFTSPANPAWRHVLVPIRAPKG